MQDIKELRKHLFETLEALKREQNPMDVNRAKAISQVAQTIIESAKVEVKFLEVTGTEMRTGFLTEAKSEPGKHSLSPVKNLSTGKQLGGGIA